jgi:hypothetical protein
MSDQQTDTSWGASYSAPAVAEQSLDGGGNYVGSAESTGDGGVEPMGNSDEIG